MNFVTYVGQNILNSFIEGAKAGGHWGRHKAIMAKTNMAASRYLILSQLCNQKSEDHE